MVSDNNYKQYINHIEVNLIMSRLFLWFFVCTLVSNSYAVLKIYILILTKTSLHLNQLGKQFWVLDIVLLRESDGAIQNIEWVGWFKT